jgi:hypothetical protein
VASRDDVDRFAGSMRDVRRLAIADLEKWWARVDITDAPVVREAVEEFVPMLVDRYGDLAATVAADWFEELREKAGARGRFTAVLAEVPPAESIRANARWSITPLFGTPPEGASVADGRAALARLTQVLDRQAMQAGRDTVALSVEHDPAHARWARVPTGAETCAFCLMLASRGAEYRTRDTADGGRYHAECDCVPTPVWDGDPYPAGYDPDALYERYQAARDAAGSGSPNAILSKLRELEGIH